MLMLIRKNAVVTPGGAAIANRWVARSMIALKTVSARYTASHVTPSRAFWKVSEPRSGTTAHSITAPLATNPPRLHWKKNGRRMLMRTWKNRTGAKFLDARK